MMKFNLPCPNAPLADDESLRVGNVYQCKGGNKTDYWIVIGLTDRAAHLLGINKDGAVTSTASYGKHVFEGGPGFNRPFLGRCDGLDELQFDIVWREKP